MPKKLTRIVTVLALLMTASYVGAEQTKTGEEAEEAGIRAAIQAYLDGTSYNDTEQIASAFYDEADLFLSHPERELYILPISEYLGFFKDREKGVANGRVGEILAVDRAGDIATAKAEIRSTRNDARYVDLFLLKKLGGEWKIISKAATRTQ
ncbi:MAG: nuclear transport factor 2 family protein [Acidobacteriota bacterium]